VRTLIDAAHSNSHNITRSKKESTNLLLNPQKKYKMRKVKMERKVRGREGSREGGLEAHHCC